MSEHHSKARRMLRALRGEEGLGGSAVQTGWCKANEEEIYETLKWHLESEVAEGIGSYWGKDLITSCDAAGVSDSKALIDSLFWVLQQEPTIKLICDTICDVHDKSWETSRIQLDCLACDSSKIQVGDNGTHFEIPFGVVGLLSTRVGTPSPGVELFQVTLTLKTEQEPTTSTWVNKWTAVAGRRVLASNEQQDWGEPSPVTELDDTEWKEDPVTVPAESETGTQGLNETEMILDVCVDDKVKSEDGE